MISKPFDFSLDLEKVLEEYLRNVRNPQPIYRQMQQLTQSVNLLLGNLSLFEKQLLQIQKICAHIESSVDSIAKQNKDCDYYKQLLNMWFNREKFGIADTQISITKGNGCEDPATLTRIGVNGVVFKIYNKCSNILARSLNKPKNQDVPKKLEEHLNAKPPAPHHYEPWDPNGMEAFNKRLAVLLLDYKPEQLKVPIVVKIKEFPPVDDSISLPVLHDFDCPEQEIFVMSRYPDESQLIEGSPFISVGKVQFNVRNQREQVLNDQGNQRITENNKVQFTSDAISHWSPHERRQSTQGNPD